MPLYLQKLNAPATLMGTILFAASLVRVLSPTFNQLLRFKAKNNIMLIFMLLSFSSLFLAYINQVYIVAFLLFLILATQSYFNITSVPMLIYSTDEGLRGRVFGIRDVFLYAGSGFGLALSGWLVAIGYHAVFWMMFVCSMLALVLTRQLKNNPNKKKDENAKGGIKQFLENYKATVRKSIFRRFLIIGIITNFTTGGIFLIALHGKNIGVSADFVLYVFAGSSIIGALFSYFGGWLVDVWSQKKLFILSGIVTALSFFMILIANNFWLFSASILLNSITLIFSTVLPVYFFSFYKNEDEGDIAWSVFSTATLIFAMISPIIWGSMWDLMNASTVFFSLFVIELIGVILAMIILPKEKKLLHDHG